MTVSFAGEPKALTKMINKNDRTKKKTIEYFFMMCNYNPRLGLKENFMA
jgi:hypothetical protein